MEHIRLTSYMRDRIMESLLHKRFDGEKKQLLKDQFDFAYRVYRVLFPEWRRMAGLPKGWLPESRYFNVRMRGERHRLELKTDTRFPCDDKERSLQDEALIKEFKLLNERIGKHDDDKVAARQQGRAMLHSVTTVKKLLEVWPEVKPFLPKDLANITTALALPVPSLNAMFRLGAQ